MDAKQFATAICFVDIPYKGYTLSLTIRDGDKEMGEATLLAMMDVISEVVLPSSMEDALDVPFESLGSEDKQPVTLEGVTGMDLGLLKYAPKASDLKPGQVFEVQVQEYKLKDGDISFWQTGGKHPQHTHNLNDYGTKKMAELFSTKWDKEFVKSEKPQAIPRGDLIIKIEASQKLTPAPHNNPYQNLVGQRRP